MDTLISHQIKPIVDSLFTNGEAHITGTSLILIKNNIFLIKNLKTSMIIAFISNCHNYGYLV